MSSRSTARPTRARVGLVVSAVVLGALLYAADQASKAWVVAHMVEGQRITVIPDLLWWRFLRNPGAAFSLGESVTWVFTLVQAAVAVVVIRLLPRARSAAWLLSLAGLLAGVLGNLTDRLFREPGFGRGHVVDFISVPHFAIFNIADSCICVSIAVIAVRPRRGVPLVGGSPESGTLPPADEGGAAAEHPEETRP